MRNKVFLFMIILLVIIAVTGAVGFIYFNQSKGLDEEGPTIDEVLKASVDVNQVTTNLASDAFIRISFKIQMDSESAKQELEKRDFQVKNIIILTLSDKTEGDLRGKEGQLHLEEELKEKISNIMQQGKVEKVYITESLLQ